MIIRAPRPLGHFTQVRNDVLRDRRLSYKARGLLVFMLSFPDYWRFRVEDLQAAGPDGRHAVTTGLAELEEHGYLKRHRKRADDGTFTTRLVVFDAPSTHDSHPGVEGLWTTPESTPENPTRVSGQSIEHGDPNIKAALKSKRPRLCGRCKGNGKVIFPEGDDVEDCPSCGGGGVA